jgi:hypothetical protein
MLKELRRGGRSRRNLGCFRLRTSVVISRIQVLFPRPYSHTPAHRMLDLEYSVSFEDARVLCTSDDVIVYVQGTTTHSCWASNAHSTYSPDNYPSCRLPNATEQRSRSVSSNLPSLHMPTTASTRLDACVARLIVRWFLFFRTEIPRSAGFPTQ